MAKEPKRMRVRRRRRTEVSAFGPLLFVGLAAVALFSWQVAILIAVGLIATIVLGFTGRGENKSQKLQTVAAANIGAVVPFIPQVWARPFELEAVLINPLNFVVMLGGAMIGYALVYVGPIIASYVLQSMAQDRMKQIAQERQVLVEAWGSDVLGNKNEGPKPNHITLKKG